MGPNILGILNVLSSFHAVSNIVGLLCFPALNYVSVTEVCMVPIETAIIFVGKNIPLITHL